MISNYSSQSGGLHGLAEGGSDSDVLHRLRPASSSLLQTQPPYKATDVPEVEYDDDLLAAVKLSADDIVRNARTAAQEEILKKMRQQHHMETENANRERQRDFRTGDTSKDNILAMIFRIVPIGINVLRKGKTVVAGLRDTATGTVNLVKNLAVTAALLGADTLNFAFQSAYYNFKVMLCAIGGISHFHKCVLFFLLDFILYLFLWLITSILFLVDFFFQVRSWVGISCVEMLIAILDGLEQFDAAVHAWVGVHPFHYPDFITDMCYSCPAMGDTSGYRNASRKMYKDIFVVVPDKIGSPLGNIVRGIGRIIDVFNV
jgi:hypothetical protein